MLSAFITQSHVELMLRSKIGRHAKCISRYTTREITRQTTSHHEEFIRIDITSSRKERHVPEHPTQGHVRVHQKRQARFRLK